MYLWMSFQPKKNQVYKVIDKANPTSGLGSIKTQNSTFTEIQLKYKVGGKENIYQVTGGTESKYVETMEKILVVLSYKIRYKVMHF